MRIGYGILALIFTIVMPYWIYLPVIFLGIIFFPLYLESIVFGLLIDVLYGGLGGMLFGYPFGIIFSILVLFAIPLREQLRFNA